MEDKNHVTKNLQKYDKLVRKSWDKKMRNWYKIWCFQVQKDKRYVGEFWLGKKCKNFMQQELTKWRKIIHGNLLKKLKFIMKEKTCSKDFEEVFQSLIQIQKINISKPRSEKPAYSKPFIWLQTKKMSERLYRSTFT